MYHFDVDVSHHLQMHVKSLILQCELQAQLSMELQRIKCIRFQSDIWSLSSPLSLSLSLSRYFSPSLCLSHTSSP